MWWIKFFWFFSEGFGSVLHSVLGTLSCCGMSWFMVCCVGSWLKGRAQRVVVNGAAPFGEHQWCSSGINSRAALFNRCISDLEAGVECIVSKFVGDTTLGGAADCPEGQEAFQSDPNQWEHWVTINRMKFNKFQCQMLQLKQSNVEHEYKLGEEWLESSSAGLEHVCSDCSKDNLEFLLS